MASRRLNQTTDDKDGDGHEIKPTYNFISWPPELGTKEETGIRYPHICAFFINENVKDNRNDVNQSRGGTTSRLAGKSVSGTTLNVVTNRISNSGFSTTTKDLLQTGAGAVGALFGADRKSIEDSIAPSYKRMNYAIFLPMPMKVRHGYDIKYNEGAMEGMWGTALTALSNEGFISAAKNTGEQFVRGALSKISAAVATQANMGEDSKSIFDKTLGTIENPRTEQVFDRVEVREFTFEWMFYPRSAVESEYLKEILDLFKENMLPSFRSDDNVGGIYTMPNEFDIEFYTSELDLEVSSSGQQETFRENRHIARISTCVLTSLQVDTTPDGKFSAFKGTGAPISISVSMTFKELSPLHRGMVGDGIKIGKTRAGGH